MKYALTPQMANLYMRGGTRRPKAVILQLLWGFRPSGRGRAALDRSKGIVLRLTDEHPVPFV